jgi:hypothetical protein
VAGGGIGAAENNGTAAKAASAANVKRRLEGNIFMGGGWLLTNRGTVLFIFRPANMAGEKMGRRAARRGNTQAARNLALKYLDGVLLWGR